jgi:hypothetical protein
MNTTELIKGKLYKDLLATQTDLNLEYIGIEETYTYFEHETKYIFKVNLTEIGKEIFKSEYKLIQLSEIGVNDRIINQTK